MTTAPDVAQMLFGDLVNVEKMDPGVSDVHAFGESSRAGTPPRRRRRRLVAVGKASDWSKKTLEGTGIAATGIGGALGVRELAESAERIGHPGLMRAVKTTGRAVPKSVTGVLKNPKVRLGAVGGMLAGDVIATGEQVRHMRRREPVDKGMPQMVEGILHNSRMMSALHAPDIVGQTKAFGEHVPAMRQKAERKGFQHANRVKATRPLVQSYGGAEGANERLNWLRENRAARQAARPAPTPKKTGSQRAISIGQGVRSDVGNFLGTTAGKATAAGAGVVGVNSAYNHHQRRVASSYDPYAMAKRDDIEIVGTISKLDDAKRLAFGWANVSKINGEPIVDRQEDYCAIEDIEEAAYAYVEGSRVGGVMHKRTVGKLEGDDKPVHVSNLVESMVFDDQKCDALGLPDEFPRGWWVGFRVHDDRVWDAAKSGKLTGFSIHGKGIRKSVSYAELGL